MTTLGDVSRAQLTQIGGTGVFVSALREALLGGEVDLAVHSLKDLPTGPAAGIMLAAVPPRDDPRDALVARDGAKLADLPARRQDRHRLAAAGRAAARAPRRPALRADPRQRRHQAGQGERRRARRGGAGLRRPGQDRLRRTPSRRSSSRTRCSRPPARAPSPSNAGTAIPSWRRCSQAVTDQASMAAVTAERSLLEALEAGCSAPIGAYAAGCGHRCGCGPPVMSPDGSRVLRAHGTAPARAGLAARPRPRGGAAAVRGRRSHQRAAGTDEQQE